MAKISCRPAGSVISLVMLILSACYSGCDGEVQSVHIVAQDFRFTPDTIHLVSGRIIDLTLFNEGREVHEFDSPLLSDRSVVIESVLLHGEPTTPDHLRIAPGRRLRLRLRVPPGTYLFFCKVRGHSGMTGMFIVN